MKTSYSPVTKSGVSHKRLLAVDIARATAIVLVVIGHWLPPGAPVGWKMFVKWIYTFHMPLFLFVSGFLFARSQKSYKAHLIGKAKRLLVPYFTTSVIIITMKLLSPGSLEVEHPVTWMSYFEMFWLPSAGYFLWFIWTLWWCFCIVPFFRTKTLHLMLFGVCTLIAYLPWNLPEIFCLKQTQHMMIWFIYGVVAYDFRDIISFGSKELAIWSGAIFCLLSAGFMAGVGLTVFVLPYVGCIAFIAVAWRSEKIFRGTFLSGILGISAASYIIYLFHTTFQGITKALLYRFLPDLPFWIVTGIVICVGVVVPWWLYAKILRKNSLARFLFGLG